MGLGGLIALGNGLAQIPEGANLGDLRSRASDEWENQHNAMLGADSVKGGALEAELANREANRIAAETNKSNTTHDRVPEGPAPEPVAAAEPAGDGLATPPVPAAQAPAPGAPPPMVGDLDGLGTPNASLVAAAQTGQEAAQTASAPAPEPTGLGAPSTTADPNTGGSSTAPTEAAQEATEAAMDQESPVPGEAPEPGAQEFTPDDPSHQTMAPQLSAAHQRLENLYAALQRAKDTAPDGKGNAQARNRYLAAAWDALGPKIEQAKSAVVQTTYQANILHTQESMDHALALVGSGQSTRAAEYILHQRLHNGDPQYAEDIAKFFFGATMTPGGIKTASGQVMSLPAVRALLNPAKGDWDKTQNTLGHLSQEEEMGIWKPGIAKIHTASQEAIEKSKSADRAKGFAALVEKAKISAGAQAHTADQRLAGKLDQNKKGQENAEDSNRSKERRTAQQFPDPPKAPDGLGTVKPPPPKPAAAATGGTTGDGSKDRPYEDKD